MIRTVKIEMFSPDEGGRRTVYTPKTISIALGFNFREQRIAVNLDNVTLEPGATLEARIEPLNGKPFEFSSREFYIMEGSRKVGKGTLIDIA